MEPGAPILEGDGEAEWIDRCAAGDRDAFRHLFKAYKDRVYSLALYTLNGDTAAAEDVSQEVFVRVYQNIAKFRREAGLGTWIYRMTANACIDELRRRKRCAPWSEVPVRSTPCSAIENVEIAAAVRSALTQLAPEQRAAVLLKYFDERSYKEMSTILGCSKGTVASRLSRALRALAARLAFLQSADPAKDRDRAGATLSRSETRLP